MRTREITLKTILWATVGVLIVVTLIRFIRGLGATTALSDATPWGFWIAFDVMAGVALAAGGFVMAGTVYIFGREAYRPFTRPAILTALLGYTAVAVGLLYDLGLPWHIWHPILYPQPHSVLFEVAMCVMLYLSVLFFEFGPVILEHHALHRPPFQRIHVVLKKLSIPLVVSGIVLSTLHQSSLGSLFLINPYRLHPLWYSPNIWVLYFASAVGLGFMMVTAESFFSSWLFGHKLRMKQLSNLGRTGAYALLIYAALRLGDLAARGNLGAAFTGSWQSVLFLFEIAASALIPAGLLMIKNIRNSPAGLATCSLMSVFGMIGYRFDTCIVAFARPEGMSYFPSWMEVAVSLGIVGGAMLVFIFFAERLKVYPEEHAGRSEEISQDLKRLAYNPATVWTMLPNRLANPRRFSLAAVLAAALALAFVPRDTLFGSLLIKTPAATPRIIEGFMQERTGATGHNFFVAKADDSSPSEAQNTLLMVIDGNRDATLVLFPHDRHIEKLGGKGSCDGCHHLNMPFDNQTSCSKCHRDTYASTDIFSHSSHIDKLGKNESCTRCHPDMGRAKNRDNSKACAKCHAGMTVKTSIIKNPKGRMQGYAVGYMDAMHGLCIACHHRKTEEKCEQYGSNFDKCATCHRDPDIFRPQHIGPYAAAQEEE
jgi:Ni/Fe-hydrogenase subunit HybB-like protein